jgi:N-acetylglucosamine-6-phosphate deacetylase
MKGRFRMLGDQGIEVWDVELEGGRLKRNPSKGEASSTLAPGFVDLHIHGACGIDFMRASQAEMIRMADLLSERGYEAFYPTTVSASARDILQAIETLPDDPRIPGFHLEGPFISPQFPGAQPPQAIRGLEIPKKEQAAWEQIFDHPKLKLVSLAPELPGAEGLAVRLASRGVRVSMGHTNATYEEAHRGFAAGVRHATHTFNAMRGLHHRELGALGFALSEDGLFNELIYDRLHVAKEAAELLLRIKPDDKVLAVSDGTEASGLPAGTPLKMWGHQVETRDGGVFLKGTDTLAGSAITLADAFRNLAEDFGVEIAIRACCLNPRKAMGLPSDPRCWVEIAPDFTIAQVFSETAAGGVP